MQVVQINMVQAMLGITTRDHLVRIVKRFTDVLELSSGSLQYTTKREWQVVKDTCGLEQSRS